MDERADVVVMFSCSTDLLKSESGSSLVSVGQELGGAQLAGCTWNSSRRWGPLAAGAALIWKLDWGWGTHLQGGSLLWLVSWCST